MWPRCLYGFSTFRYDYTTASLRFHKVWPRFVKVWLRFLKVALRSPTVIAGSPTFCHGGATVHHGSVFNCLKNNKILWISITCSSSSRRELSTLYIDNIVLSWVRGGSNMASEKLWLSPDSYGGFPGSTTTLPAALRQCYGNHGSTTVIYGSTTVIYGYHQTVDLSAEVLNRLKFPWPATDRQGWSRCQYGSLRIAKVPLRFSTDRRGAPRLGLPWPTAACRSPEPWWCDCSFNLGTIPWRTIRGKYNHKFILSTSFTFE